MRIPLSCPEHRHNHLSHPPQTSNSGLNCLFTMAPVVTPINVYLREQTVGEVPGFFPFSSSLGGLHRQMPVRSMSAHTPPPLEALWMVGPMK